MPTNPNLKKYIKLCHQQGFKDEEILNALVGAGWDKKMAESALMSGFIKKVILWCLLALAIAALIGGIVWGINKFTDFRNEATSPSLTPTPSFSHSPTSSPSQTASSTEELMLFGASPGASSTPATTTPSVSPTSTRATK